MAIYFHNEGDDFNYKYKQKCRKWITEIVENALLQVGDINIIFSSDSYLLKINQEYLNHNYHTDVITFDYSESRKISGDIFIGINKVKENSDRYGVSLISEINRVIIHGVLHLIGYDDGDEKGSRKMKKLENEALNLWDK